jgi:UDP-N-acetylmuramate dehydrogenase
MDIKENVPLAGKTTMRIGGMAKYFAELQTKEDVEQAYAFAKKKNVPIIPLGGGSNTLFADGVIDALIVRTKAAKVTVDGNRATVEAGMILASLLNDLAGYDLDLSALTGIPGSVGAAVFGNAGQGPSGTWIDSYIDSVTAYVDDTFQTFAKAECDFRYRESRFKDKAHANPARPPLIWEVTLTAPSRPQAEVKAEIERLINKRIETQPHLRTAGSCFKAVGQTPAWKLIDAAGLRGLQIGGIQIAEKHANFLLNVAQGSFADAKAIVEKVRSGIPEPLSVEMRFIENDGHAAY